MKQTWIAFWIVASLLAGGLAQAALLVDTGPGGASPIGSPSLFDSPTHFQYLGGRFTLSSPATLDSVEGWMVGGGGPIDVRIRADGAVPGTAIYSKNYTLGSLFTAGWEVFSAYNATLPAGTYWLCFEPSPGGGMNRTMPKGAPAPLSSYAYLGDGNPGWLVLLPNPGLGMRVSGGPVITAPLGTAIRAIEMITPQNVTDFVLGGDDKLQTYWGVFDFNGYGLAVGRGTIFANGLQAGAVASNSNANLAARAVAWRSFKNGTAGTLALRVNANLHGGFFQNGGSTLKAWGGIHALDAEMFASTIAASGKTSAKFLLDGASLNPLTGAADRPSLAVLFPVAARLGSDVEALNYTPNPVAAPMQTPLISIAPNQVFTLLFDVTALASGTLGSGTTNFVDTLEPAAVMFTDAGGNAVSGIQPLGASVSVGEAGALLWYDQESPEWLPAVGATAYRLYRGIGDDLPSLLDFTADSCLQYEGVDTYAWPVSEIPPPGTFFWYLAVGVNGATEGSAGDATAGERVVNSSGTCD